jgi:hypothetical protein
MFSSSVHAFSSRPPPPRFSDNWAPAISFVPHLQLPELARAATDSRSPSAAPLRTSGALGPLPPRLHFPSLNSPPEPLIKPAIFNVVKDINTGINRLDHLSRRSPDPYKGRAISPSFTSPLPALISLSPSSSLSFTERRHHRAFPIIARPPRRRSNPGEALEELPMLTIEQPCSDVLAHTPEVCKGTHPYNDYSAI